MMDDTKRALIVSGATVGGATVGTVRTLTLGQSGGQVLGALTDRATFLDGPREVSGTMVVDVPEEWDRVLDSITIEPRPGREKWRGLFADDNRNVYAELQRRNDVRPGVVPPADARPLPAGTMTRQQRRQLARKGRP